MLTFRFVASTIEFVTRVKIFVALSKLFERIVRVDVSIYFPPVYSKKRITYINLMIINHIHTYVEESIK